MASNNYYYKLIYELLYGEEVEETHNDLWYLKRIAYYYQYTEEAIRCKGKYLKEIAHGITGETYNSSHSNNYYLRKMANSLSGETTRWLTENYYLKIISQYIGNDKTPTILTLDTPMLVYTDVFDVTGTLTDDEENPISDATITLEWTVNGNTQSTTSTTDSNGQVIFHNSKVTTINQYSFKLKYSGSNEYNRATSSVVNVTPSKESTVVNVTNPSSGGTVYTDGGIQVTGTVKTNDDEPVPNKQVVVRLANTVIKTMTTNNNGVFNDTISGLNTGSNTLIFECTASSEYSSSALDRTFTVSQPSLTSDKSILSFADEDSCIITAHYNQSGKTVKLYDYSDDSEIGTMTDNGDGTYSYEYDSEGVGDRTFYAKYSTFLTKTFEVHDYWKYIASATQTFSSSNLEWINLCDLTSLTDYEITATLKSTQNKGFSLSVHQNNNNDNTYLVRNGVDSSSHEGINVILSSGVAESHYPSPNIPYSANTDLNVKITKQNGVYTMEIGNYSSAINNPPNIQYIGVDSWNIAKTLTITDFIVKTL